MNKIHFYVFLIDMFSRKIDKGAWFGHILPIFKKKQVVLIELFIGFAIKLNFAWFSSFFIVIVMKTQFKNLL